MDKDILTDTLHEWTEGLDAGESRIAVFSHIRDMPYEIIADLKDPLEGPALILEAGRGSCTPKHYLLFEMFRLLEIPVQLATYPFYWDDPDVAYPLALKALAEKAPLEYHLACKAHLDGEWVLVDATFDPPLRGMGFPVNTSWDGVSDTRNAVKPLDEILHVNTVERADFVNRVKGMYTEEEQRAMDEFVEALNAWCEEIRGGA
ncbi:MAG: hypothetical protein SWK76_01230 [Actinomycetota bacterium]|nr:hypothetical protein [Actinomycetota bacterium]